MYGKKKVFEIDMIIEHSCVCVCVDIDILIFCFFFVHFKVDTKYIIKC